MPARHTSLQDNLLLKSRSRQVALVDERGCRRDIRSTAGSRVGRVRSPNIGPAEETSFLRSVRILGSAISPASTAQVKYGPDVFADARVPCAAAHAGAFGSSHSHKLNFAEAASCGGGGIVSRRRAALVLLRRAGTRPWAAWVPDQRRTTLQVRRAAPHPGHESIPMVIVSRNRRVNRIWRSCGNPHLTSASAIHRRAAPNRVYDPFIAILKLPFKFDRS
ncbi:MAG: hypothetical protein JWR80_9182 [Bradyrhizobium sp.]|nr:hypothetical protein [Bradyrhizobium sp.]